MAPVADRGEKTPFEDAGNRCVCLLEGILTATRCKQQGGEASPELQALMVTAQRGKMKPSRNYVERRVGLFGLSRKPGFTNSKLLPMPENTESITEHIPAAAKPQVNQELQGQAGWKRRLHKESDQTPTLGFTCKAFFRS